MAEHHLVTGATGFVGGAAAYGNPGQSDYAMANETSPR